MLYIDPYREKPLKILSRGHMLYIDPYREKPLKILSETRRPRSLIFGM